MKNLEDRAVLAAEKYGINRSDICDSTIQVLRSRGVPMDSAVEQTAKNASLGDRAAHQKHGSKASMRHGS
jgi:hypothetical protein